MGFYVNITQRLGQLILAENNVAYQAVTFVDLTKDGDWGYSSWTPGWLDYEVIVHYLDGEGNAKQYDASYDSMSEIVNLLVKIADEEGDSEPKLRASAPQSFVGRLLNYVVGR